MPDVSDLISKYIEAWNQTDAAARRDLIGEIWAPDGRYIDPLADVTGPEQVDGVIEAVQAQFPGLKFRLAGPVDAHHDQARFTWELAPAGADAVVVGFDVARRDEDGRLALVLGFLDKVPAG
jgi:SnoaL-like domain